MGRGPHARPGGGLTIFHIVLFQPEIPPNTGNAIRLCANAGAHLHLVEPLGFLLEDKLLRRAGLDYREMASVTVHRDWEACRAGLGAARTFAVSTRASTLYADVRYRAGDAFVFGSETAGLPEAFLASFEPAARIRLPMRPGNRSLNLSNAVAVVTFEAWRQVHFDGAA